MTGLELRMASSSVRVSPGEREQPSSFRFRNPPTSSSGSAASPPAGSRRPVVADISDALRPVGEVPDPAQAIVVFAADNDHAHLVRVDGAVGLRIEKTGAASVEKNEDFGTH
jgi:hypothetical protein